ncbi:flagellar basal body rod protein FlgB [bacterium BMS3Bbin04]|nr:flagellar basal body rod protein FlgB [bacterium BMS3Bbin04]
MIRELIFDNTLLPLPLYRNALDAYAARHRAVASNIANASTPGYIPTRVSFETQLAKSLNRRQSNHHYHPDHIAGAEDYRTVRHAVWKDLGAENANGANGVDIEKETTILLTNNMHYAMAAKRTAGLFADVEKLSKLK